MSLQTALNVALTGLGASNAGIDVVARNVANADAPGYTRKTAVSIAQIVGNTVGGARLGQIERQVDQFVQQQLRTEIGIAALSDIRANFLDQLDRLFGAPGEANALDTIVNEFGAALQQLTTSPENQSSREAVIARAGVLASHLNRLSDTVQGLRHEAEQRLGRAVERANVALGEIARLNREIQLAYDSNLNYADIADQRDRYIDELSAIMDIRVIEAERGDVRVFTGNGNLLVDVEAGILTFDERSGLDAGALYSIDDAVRGTGTIKLTTPIGAQLDLFRHGDIRTGEIAALRELRDVTLVTAQSQLDELAHGLAMAMSSKTVEGVAASAGVQTGFDVDVNELAAGNSLSLTVTQGGVPKTFTIVRVDDPATLPLPGDVTADPNDTVIGIDFSGGTAAAAAALDAALDAALGVDVSVSAPGAGTIRILNDAGGTVSIDSLTATVTPTALQDSGLQVALFIDRSATNLAYTASLDGRPQKLGYAGRIAVNPALVADSSLLVLHSSTASTGDPARPLELAERFASARIAVAPQTGIGTPGQPVETTVADLARRIVNHHGQLAQAAERASEAQSIVLDAVRTRYAADTRVDVDAEMARLLELENAYAANARVMTVIQELMAVLMRI